MVWHKTAHNPITIASLKLFSKGELVGVAMLRVISNFIHFQTMALAIRLTYTFMFVDALMMMIFTFASHRRPFATAYRRLMWIS